jgi:hypothetical protein
LLKVRALEFRDERIQPLVVRGAIGRGGTRDEWRDERYRQKGLLRIVALRQEEKEPDALSRIRPRKRSMGLWVHRFMGHSHGTSEELIP